jgi:hypothetical protein
MQGYCNRIVERVGRPEPCGRVLNVDGTCSNRHVRVRDGEMIPYARGR